MGGMLDYNEIKVGEFIIFEGEPYEVLDSHVFRKQQRKPVNATKLKNLISGRVVEHSFHVSDKATQAEIEKRQIKFLYANRGQFWFCEENDPAKRFELPLSLIGEQNVRFMKTNVLVTALVFDEKIFEIQLPVKIILIVKDAPPGVRGDTSKSGTKLVTLETGGTLDVPLFVQTGDKLEINTVSGEYASRAEK